MSTLRYRILCGLAIVSAIFMAKDGQAQLDGILDRTYTMVGVGGQAYLNDANDAFNYLGYEAEFGIGANIFDNIGARMCGMISHNSNIDSVENMYFSLHADLTLNLSNMIRGKDAKRKHNVQGLIGMGFIRRNANYKASADNEFTLVPGLSYTYPLLNGIYLMLEGKVYVFMPAFDHNKRLSAMFMGTVGLHYRFNDNPYRNGLNAGAHSTKENWYISLSGGVNSLQYTGLQSSERMHLLKPAVEVMVGKYLSPVVGIRLGVHGLSAATSETSFNIVQPHIDVMLNIQNMKYPMQNRPFNLSVYAGMGVLDRTDEHILNIAVDAGVLVRLWLTSRSDITADVRYTLTTPRLLPELTAQGSVSVGMITAMVGYCYNLTAGSLR